MTGPALGRIITFYSYKGGTGRSMALANIAWMLASAGRRVLAIDWDLEAPGLHRYFRPFLIDDELTATEGLMDLVDAYANQAIKPADDSTAADPDWFLPYTDFSDHVVSVNFPHFRAGGKIDLLPAGKQGDRYATIVSSFNWQNFYDRLGGGGFFEAVKQRARDNYDYVLIDSRTGVSDTAGICSVQMPESLVVCFTYNNQSIKGAAAVAKSARDTHKRMVAEKLALPRTSRSAPTGSFVEETPRTYRVFPVPMRVDDGESDRLAVRQAFAQQAFADLVSHVSAADVVSDYWRPVEVPYAVFYAYEEVLAPFKDDARDPKTVLAALLRLTRFVTDGDVVEYQSALSPQERQAYLEAFAKVGGAAPARPAHVELPTESEEQILARKAEHALATLDEGDRAAAGRVLLRLVRVGTDEEESSLSLIRSALSDFTQVEQAVVAKLASQGLVTIDSRPAQGTSRPEPSVALADARLLTSWRTLIEWIDRDRPFLIWRQQLRRYMADWERSGRDSHALLSGRLFSEADLNAVRRPDDLTAAEMLYINESRVAIHDAARQSVPAPPRAGTPVLAPRPAVVPSAASRPAFWRWGAAAALAVVVTLGVVLWQGSGTLNNSTPPPAVDPTGVNSAAPQVTVPRLIDLSSTDARTAAEALGLRVVMTDGTTEGPDLQGVVLNQSPKESETIASGGTIRLTVSSLTAGTPTLTGLTLSAALRELSTRRFTLGKTESRYVPDAKPDTVITQDPAPGTNLALGAPVHVTVARAAQLSDFKVGIYHVNNDPASKVTAERIRNVVRRAGATADLLPRPPEFFVGRLAATRNEIRYGSAQEAGVARELQLVLQKAGDLPAFAPRVVGTPSQQFISIFLLPDMSKGDPSQQARPRTSAN